MVGDVWLRDTSESETGLAKPYLLGCDLQGRIVWMSDRAQAELGSPENLPAEFTGRMRAGSSFWIWQQREGLQTC